MHQRLLGVHGQVQATAPHHLQGRVQGAFFADCNCLKYHTNWLEAPKKYRKFHWCYAEIPDFAVLFWRHPAGLSTTLKSPPKSKSPITCRLSVHMLNSICMKGATPPVRPPPLHQLGSFFMVQCRLCQWTVSAKEGSAPGPGPKASSCAKLVLNWRLGAACRVGWKVLRPSVRLPVQTWAGGGRWRQGGTSSV